MIAEDSWRRAVTTQEDPHNPNGRRVVDAIWNFAFQDEARRLLRGGIYTAWGQPSRRDRIRALVTGNAMWDDWDHRFKEGFTDMAQAVNYITSHDVAQEHEQRFMNYVFGDLLRQRGLADGSVNTVRHLLDNISSAEPEVLEAHAEALDRVGSAFALLLTAPGIPMLLAGEEFGDVHDLDHSDWRLKMSDPVDWRRRDQPGHRALWHRVQDLVRLRTSSAVLQRNEVEFLYFHPTIDENDGPRVFAYARTGGRPLGSPHQVLVVVNAGAHDFPAFDLPWTWTDVDHLAERGVPPRGTRLQIRPDRRQATLSLAPFQVRVFTT